MNYYIEVDGIPVVSTFQEWAVWFNAADRTIKKTDTSNYWVSTVFIGMCGVIYETMVFPYDSMIDERCVRSSTKEAALQAHNDLVREFQPSPLDILD